MAEIQITEQISHPEEGLSTEWTGEVASPGNRTGKYLTFTLAKEDYGLGILKIKEIIGMQKIAPIPQTPVFVKGVINLRGKVIPVVDLRFRFGVEDTAYTDRSGIIIVEIPEKVGTVHMGIVVDSVSEVMHIRAEEIEDTPTFGTNLCTEYILGMAKMDGRVKILLDIDRVLSGNEFAMMENTN